MKKVALILELLIAMALAFFAYTLTHELGHAIVVALLGGDVFSIAFLPLPHVTTFLDAVYTSEVIAVSVAGLVFPLILSLLFSLLPKGKGVYRLWVTLFQSMVSLSFLVNTVVAVLYPTMIVENDDIVVFLDTTGWNPYLVAAASGLLFLLNTRIIFLLRPIHTFERMLGHVHE